MASVVHDLFFPSIRLTIILYAIILVVSDVSLACAISMFGFIVSVLFFLRYALPPHRGHRTVERFFALAFLGNDPDDPAPVELDPVVDFSYNSSDCIPESSEPGSTTNTSKVFTIAHRTLALDAPENSISGILKASSVGFNGVQFDVQLSADNVLVLFHDASVDRVTGAVGDIKDMTVEQLKKLDISSSHLPSAEFEGEKVPTLEEAINECLRMELKMFIDVKFPSQRILAGLRDLFEKYPALVDEAMVVSSWPFFLYQLRCLNESILTGLVWRPHSLSLLCPTGVLEHARPRYRERWKQMLAVVGDVVIDWMLHSLVWYLCGVSTILAHKDSISREYLNMWHVRRIKVLAWPVNDPYEKQYLTGVQKVGYLTDTLMPQP